MSVWLSGNSRAGGAGDVERNQDERLPRALRLTPANIVRCLTFINFWPRQCSSFEGNPNDGAALAENTGSGPGRRPPARPPSEGSLCPPSDRLPLHKRDQPLIGVYDRLDGFPAVTVLGLRFHATFVDSMPPPLCFVIAAFTHKRLYTANLFKSSVRFRTQGERFLRAKPAFAERSRNRP
jgi:hypothetical protein